MRGITAVVLCCALASIALTSILSTNFDFRAFYCAGRAVRLHANPYHTEPLHTCERTHTDGAFAVFSKKVALPAPQPGYDMAFFAIISAVPFSIASRLWSLLLALCALLAVVFVRRLTGLSFPFVLATFWLSLALSSLYLGELVPLCVLAVAAAAFFAREGRWTAAGFAAAGSLVEPHIGVPICAALLLWAPASRAAIAASACGLAALSLATIGWNANIEYLTAVLPAHALSELGSDAQLSASVVLHALGVSDADALRAGTLSYAAMCAFGLWLARALRASLRDDAVIVAVPVAAAVLGGVFIHVIEAAAALPLALLLASRMPERPLRYAAVLVLLAIPWWCLVTPILLGPIAGLAFSAIAATYLVWRYSGNGLAALAAGPAIFVAAAFVMHWYGVSAHAFVPHVAALPIDPAYPEASWWKDNMRFVATGVPASWLLRVPTWLGLIATISAACAAAFPKPLRAQAVRA